MLIAEIVILCGLFFVICYFNTGSDKKNIKSFSSYPNEVQHIVKENHFLNDKIKIITPFISFISNIIMFVVILFIFGLFMKQANFIDNFTSLLILGQILNLFDFLIIDILWWRNSKRIRFTGTENMDNIYKNPKNHFISFIKGIFVFLIVAVIDGLLLSFF
ncbi:hypothetical protein [uncultured Clostridium sp.]|uniref:hypothetical protein n=1 Tax=uncultured Clostridium sp. TaxID=59620 RepID=UPI0028E1C845|nr:hypothetical protein [uncultured Clostridium sp.]